MPSQRPVLITGATGALGGAVVQRFLAAGSRVLAVGRDEDALAGLRDAAPSDRIETSVADLARPSAVAGVFDRAESWAGPPAAVVHLAGGFRHGELATTTDDDWRFLVSANLETTFLVLRESARRFESTGGGSVVAVSAPAALVGEAGFGAYSATKAAVLRLVEALAREIGPAGGRANAVLPGTMDTPANRAAMPRADASRWVSTDAVAEVVHYLTTPAGAAVNGAAVRVSGRTF